LGFELVLGRRGVAAKLTQELESSTASVVRQAIRCCTLKALKWETRGMNKLREKKYFRPTIHDEDNP